MSSFEKAKATRKQLPVPFDDGQWCPLVNDYDEDIHNAISQMRSLDGTVPPLAKHGPPLPGPPVNTVNFFAPYGQPKFWVKKGAHPFGYFFFYALDKAICPFLAETLVIPLLHPTTLEQVDKLLAAIIDV